MMLYSIQLISIHVLKALGCFSVLPRENNGTDKDTLSLDIVNFREVIFFMTEVLYPETSAYLIVLFLVSVPLL